ncbi:hypothetical protein C1645_825865 [Glomus cerebriforme]|uniref:Uncharacterized protein n=1 Tax=Glomus cerebriforme TaxID=658196 RepID=A0A397SRM4_9GLOM|nr:hypothetical protein C1645_825865 [Glomus cerebriforme]
MIDSSNKQGEFRHLESMCIELYTNENCRALHDGSCLFKRNIAMYQAVSCKFTNMDNMEFCNINVNDIPFLFGSNGLFKDSLTLEEFNKNQEEIHSINLRVEAA